MVCIRVGDTALKLSKQISNVLKDFENITVFNQMVDVLTNLCNILQLRTITYQTRLGFFMEPS